MNDAASPANSAAQFAVRDWCLAVLTAGILGFGLLSWPLVLFDTPAELLGVDMYSPMELQEAAAANAIELKWKNTIAYMIQLALCFAITGLVCKPNRFKVFGINVAVALVAGALAGVVAVLVRDTLIGISAIPGVQPSIRGMVDDILVFGSSSALVVLPAAVPWLLTRNEHRLQRAITVVVSGVVGGACFPFIASLVSTDPTHFMPPASLTQKALWMVVLCGLVILFTATASPKKSKVVEEPAASE